VAVPAERARADRGRAADSAPRSIGPWHALTVDEALAATGARPGGLASAAAAERLRERGPIRIATETGEPLWRELTESQRPRPQALMLEAQQASDLAELAKDPRPVYSAPSEAHNR
jgi:hypothetical protein